MPIIRVLAAFCVLFFDTFAIPCLNGGLPVYTRGQLKCQCSNNEFWGERCQFAVSKLRPKRCVNGAYTQNKCLCKSGYEGVNCDLPICGAHGIRFIANRSRCICESGYDGEFCELSSSKTYCLHGIRQHGKCVCRRFWQGDACDWPICGSNGWVDATTKKCQCDQNFAPPFCQTCVAGYWGKKCARRVGGADGQKTDDGSTGALPNEYFHARFGATSWLVAAPVFICLIVACGVAICRLQAEAALWNHFGSRQYLRQSYSGRRGQRVNSGEVVALSTTTSVRPPAYEAAVRQSEAPPSYEDAMRVKTS